ncbi:uncharacterized protein LOC106358751 [Brassica napus]|uniref:uncharacterized protein LOC106358751 n=1 Tax=Brassica napus TaxID=3708 RepID=UPI0020787301|nr:uncharacterized protein LOC106358751 [Brassica napus]
MEPRSFRRFHLNTIDSAESTYMISSFNGVICCVNRVRVRDANEFCDLKIWIVNPCTGETLLLPQRRPSFQFQPSVGVAYGSTDYKVFRIYCSGKKVPEEMVFERYDFREGQLDTVYRYTLAYECEVYSSITGVWENIGHVPCVPMYLHLSPFSCGHVFVGGKIYWMSSLDDEGAILSVDLEGRFEVIQLSLYEGDQKEEDMITEATYLINLQGCLSVVILHPEHMDVWIRMGSGENVSWILLCQDTTPVGDNDIVLAMTCLENKIICVTEEKWCCYNIDTRRWKRTNHGGLVNHPTVYPFTESFLPCIVCIQCFILCLLYLSVLIPCSLFLFFFIIESGSGML